MIPQRMPTKSFSACWQMRASRVLSIESPDSSACARAVATSIDAEELSQRRSESLRGSANSPRSAQTLPSPVARRLQLHNHSRYAAAAARRKTIPLRPHPGTPQKKQQACNPSSDWPLPSTKIQWPQASRSRHYNPYALRSGLRGQEPDRHADSLRTACETFPRYFSRLSFSTQRVVFKLV
jgi:hypothetical protein